LAACLFRGTHYPDKSNFSRDDRINSLKRQGPIKVAAVGQKVTNIGVVEFTLKEQHCLEQY
jgi:hypothetical protein